MIPIAQGAYRIDRSYSWNYEHAPKLPRVRRLPTGPGGRLLGHDLNSQVGVSAGPLLNSKWVEAYARVGFDILTYATVRTSFAPPLGLPN
ncbi:MAG: dihydroorotate dehydrogenase, partial [Candidatus Rokuibacteriota bacterium]